MVFKKIKNSFRKKGNKHLDNVPMPKLLQEQEAWDQKLVFSLAKQRWPNWQQLQYLPQYLTQREKLIIRVLLAITILCLGFLLVQFYQRHVVYLPEQGGSYTEALIGQPQYINPILAQSDVDRDLTTLIYSGLFRYNQSLELVPDLAERYEVSEDNKTYTVYLQQDITWHNGNPLLADDVVFTFSTIQDPDYSSPLYSNFDGVTIRRVDDYTVSFTLDEPYAPFLSNLTVGILPGHIWNDVTPATFRLAEFNTKPIGSGPFVFTGLTKDQTGNIKSYTLKRNESYYGQQPYLNEISFRLFPEFADAFNVVRSNNVDGITFIPNEYSGVIEKNNTINRYQLQLPQYTAVFFNQKIDLLKSENLKQALAHAVDKNRILQEALAGDGTIVHSTILPGFLGHNPDIQGYSYDLNQAATLLDEAGWTVPEDGGLRQKDGQELKFSLTTVDQTEYLKTADILRESWEAVGVGIELKIMNPSRVNKEIVKPRNYEAFLYGEIVGADPDPYPFWHSSQSLAGGLNLSNYFNKEVDTLLEEARKIDNADERADKYRAFQNIIAEEIPAIFLYSPYYEYGVHEDIQGITIERITIPSDRFNGITNWYSKTKFGWE